MTTQRQIIHGTCGAHAAVNVVNLQGEILASTRANGNGSWTVEMDATIGSKIRADVKNEAGRQVKSDWLDVVRQDAAEAEPEAAPVDEVVDEEAADLAACRPALRHITAISWSR